MTMTTATDIAVTTAKSVVILDHIKNNRIEYLLMVGILHLVGITNKAYSHVSGVCL